MLWVLHSVFLYFSQQWNQQFLISIDKRIRLCFLLFWGKLDLGEINLWNSVMKSEGILADLSAAYSILHPV